MTMTLCLTMFRYVFTARRFIKDHLKSHGKQDADDGLVVMYNAMLHREERDIWRGKSDCDELLMWL